MHSRNSMPVEYRNVPKHIAGTEDRVCGVRKVPVYSRADWRFSAPKTHRKNGTAGKGANDRRAEK